VISSPPPQDTTFSARQLQLARGAREGQMTVHGGQPGRSIGKLLDSNPAPAAMPESQSAWIAMIVGYPSACAFVGLVTHRVNLHYNPKAIAMAGTAVSTNLCAATPDGRAPPPG
jgi:hypothetical protein